MKRHLSVLGSTGSIGTQTLQIARALSLPVEGLAAGGNIALLEEQVREFCPKTVCVFDETKAKELAFNIKDTATKVVSGMDGLCEVATISQADMTVTAVSGWIGLLPTVEAIRVKKTIALANKETLVAGGEIVTREAKENGVDILPVDSEHNALFQCLLATKDRKNEVKRLILTASGGPFYGKDAAFLKNVKKENALKHPNWNMGAKVTIDSATMMNKGLEVLEAKWLFDLPLEQIDVVIHRQSLVHSMVEYKDGAILAELASPDMRLPIQYAITYPEREQGQVKPLSLFDLPPICFEQPDDVNFPCLSYCRRAGEIGGTMPAAVCVAGEMAVKLFLADKIGFTDINYIVKNALDTHVPVFSPSLDVIMQTAKDEMEKASHLI